MTVNEAITLTTKYAGAPVEGDLIYKWLQNIEDTIYEEIILTHQFPCERPAPVRDGDRELLAPEPYSELYVHYLNMQNDLFIRDHHSYANSSVAFALSYASFADWYNRTYMPLCQSEEIRV